LTVKESWATSQNGGSHTSLSNQAGIVATGDLVIEAGRDLVDLAGKITAGNAFVTAGNDIRFDTIKTGSTYESQISGYTQNDSSITHALSQIDIGGELGMKAGGSLNLTGTQVAIGTSGSGTGWLSAGKDVNIAAVVNEVNTSQYNDPASKMHDRQVHANQTIVSAGVASSGDLLVSAGIKTGGDLNVTGSVLVGDGNLVLEAGNDIRITGLAERHLSDTAIHRESSSFLKSSSTTAAQYSDRTEVVGSTVSGGSVMISSGRDALLSGSTVVADNNIDINAGRDLTIVSAERTTSERSSSSSKKSGLVGGASIGTIKSTQDRTLEEVTQVGSQIASLGGNINLSAGNQYTQTASIVMAPKGDIAIEAKDVLVNAGSDRSQGSEDSSYSKTAIGISVSVPLLENVQAVSNMKKAGDNAGDGRMKALATLNAGFNIIDGASALKGLSDDPKKGVSVSVSLGSSKSESHMDRKSKTSVGSSISAGGNISIVATGGGVDSNLNVIGSSIKAGGDVALAADNDINLLAGENTASQHSNNKSSGASIGIGFSFGGQQNGFSLNVGANKAQGRADGEDLVYQNTHVTGGGTVKVTSGGDTTLKGALIDGKSVQANVGGDLNIESLQDRSTYESKQKTAGISASICIPPFCTGTSSVSGNVGKSNATGEYLSVVEQSGIKAGDGGFQITVGSNTDLKGGIISSTDAAITDGQNFLDTGTLTTSDLVNKSDANASSSGFGLSSNMLEGKYQTGKALLGNAINSADLSASSVGQTYSAVGEGKVVVRNEGKQIELTGHTAGQMIAELNRDTDNTNRSAEKHDVAVMQEAVNNVRSNREAIFNEATKFTDEAYRTMFISKAEFYVLIKDENGEVILGEDDRPLRRKLSEEEKLYLKADAKGNVNIANNGIFNDEKAAAKYAEQHSTTNGEQYFIHFPEANGVTSELMIAGYQKYLEGDILGLTNATKEVKWALNHYGSSGLHLDGHSRGSMTIGNALQSLLNDMGAEGKLSQTTINLFGPAFNAEKADHLLGLLQGRDFKDPAVQHDFVIQLQNHYLDPVGALNGKNPGTGGTLPEGSFKIKEIFNVMFGDVTAHNCYGSGGLDCGPFWNDSPQKEPEFVPVNKLKTEK